MSAATQTRRDAIDAGKRGEATDRQAAILAFIRAYRRETGVPPTYRDIGRKFAINVNAVRGHVVSMLRKGLLRQVGANLSRCYVPVEAADAPRCSCCGQAIPETAETD